MRLLINNKTGVVFPWSEVLAKQDGIRLMTSDELKERGHTPSGEVSKRLGKRLELPEDLTEMSKGQLNEFVMNNRLKISLNVDKSVGALRDEVVSLVREHNKDYTDAIEEMPDSLPENFYKMNVKELRKFASEPGGHLKSISLNGATTKSVIQEKIIMELKYQERTLLDNNVEADVL